MKDPLAKRLKLCRKFNRFQLLASRKNFIADLRSSGTKRNGTEFAAVPKRAVANSHGGIGECDGFERAARRKRLVAEFFHVRRQYQFPKIAAAKSTFSYLPHFRWNGDRKELASLKRAVTNVRQGVGKIHKTQILAA